LPHPYQYSQTPMTSLHNMLAISLFSFLFVQAASFATLATSPTRTRQNIFGSISQFPSLKERSDDNGEVEYKIPQLPAIATSSLHQGCSTANGTEQGSPSMEEASGEKANDVAFLSPKFQLQYTCKVCDTRNHHLVSRIGKK